METENIAIKTRPVIGMLGTPRFFDDRGNIEKRSTFWSLTPINFEVYSVFSLLGLSRLHGVVN